MARVSTRKTVARRRVTRPAFRKFLLLADSDSDRLWPGDAIDSSNKRFPNTALRR